MRLWRESYSAAMEIGLAALAAALRICNKYSFLSWALFGRDVRWAYVLCGGDFECGETGTADWVWFWIDLESFVMWLAGRESGLAG